MSEEEIAPPQEDVNDWLEAHGIDGWYIPEGGEVLVDWYKPDPLTTDATPTPIVRVTVIRPLNRNDVLALDRALHNTRRLALRQTWGNRL